MKDFKSTVSIGLFLAAEAYLLSTLGNLLLPKFGGKFELLFITSIVAAYGIYAAVRRVATTQKNRILVGVMVLFVTLLLIILLMAVMYYFWDLF